MEGIVIIEVLQLTTQSISGPVEAEGTLSNSLLLEESLFYNTSDVCYTDLVAHNSLKIQQIYTGNFTARIHFKVFPAPTPLPVFPVLSSSTL